MFCFVKLMPCLWAWRLSAAWRLRACLAVFCLETKNMSSIVLFCWADALRLDMKAVSSLKTQSMFNSVLFRYKVYYVWQCFINKQNIFNKLFKETSVEIAIFVMYACQFFWFPPKSKQTNKPKQRRITAKAISLKKKFNHFVIQNGFSNLLLLLHSLLDLWGSPFLVRFLHTWSFFIPAIEVVIFRLGGWCMLSCFCCWHSPI